MEQSPFGRKLCAGESYFKKATPNEDDDFIENEGTAMMVYKGPYFPRWTKNNASFLDARVGNLYEQVCCHAEVGI